MHHVIQTYDRFLVIDHFDKHYDFKFTSVSDLIRTYCHPFDRFVLSLLFGTTKLSVSKIHILLFILTFCMLILDAITQLHLIIMISFRIKWNYILISTSKWHVYMPIWQIPLQSKWIIGEFTGNGDHAHLFLGIFMLCTEVMLWSITLELAHPITRYISQWGFRMLLPLSQNKCLHFSTTCIKLVLS